MELIQTVNYWLALGTLLTQLAAAYILVEYFFFSEQYVVPIVARFAVLIVFALGTTAALLTLVYSEIFGLIPCGLCWLERVCLYPIPILAAFALWRKRSAEYVRACTESIMALSAIGAVISLYHHYIQMGGSAFAACPTAGAGADCAKRAIFEFGYITFPLMACTLFVTIIVVLYIYRMSVRSEQR